MSIQILLILGPILWAIEGTRERESERVSLCCELLSTEPNGSLCQIYGDSSPHCYRREKVDWSDPTPETIIHYPLRSISFSQSTSASIGHFFGPIKRNHCLPGPRANYFLCTDDYFGLNWRSISSLFFSCTWEMDCYRRPLWRYG